MCVSISIAAIVFWRWASICGLLDVIRHIDNGQSSKIGKVSETCFHYVSRRRSGLVVRRYISPPSRRMFSSCFCSSSSSRKREIQVMGGEFAITGGLYLRGIFMLLLEENGRKRPMPWWRIEA